MTLSTRQTTEVHPGQVTSLPQLFQKNNQRREQAQLGEISCTQHGLEKVGITRERMSDYIHMYSHPHDTRE